MNETDEITTRLRQALHAEAGRVEPSAGGLEAIRSRTAPPQRSVDQRRPWLLGAVTASLAAAATIVVVTMLAGSGPETSPRPVDEPTSSQRATSSQRQAAPVTVPVYYVGDGGIRLYREFHRVKSTDPPAEVALRQMLRREPVDPDYFTPWDGDVSSVRHKAGVITVNLRDAVAYRGTDLLEPAGEVAVQQLVYTVQAALQSTDPVVIHLAGVSPNLGASIPTGRPIERADPLKVQAMVQITEPTDGAVVSSPVTVEGVANVFEANVNWEVLEGDQVVKEGFTMTGGAFEFSPFKETIDLPPGDYTLRFFEASAKDGRPTHVDTKTITVR